MRKGMGPMLARGELRLLGAGMLGAGTLGAGTLGAGKAAGTSLAPGTFVGHFGCRLRLANAGFVRPS